MSGRAEIDIVLMVDDSGDYVIGKDEQNCREAWDDELAHLPSGLATYHISLSVPLPGAQHVSGEVVANGGPLRLIVSNS